MDRDGAGAPLPQELMRTAARQGLQAFALPKEIGGEDADPLAWGMVLEQIGYRCEDVAFPLLLSVRTTIAKMLVNTGRADLIERYAMPIAAGRCAAATAYTEDADPFTMGTRLRSTGAGYVLDGHKTYVSGGLLADVFLTYPVDETGDMIACLVHRDDPGVEVNPVDAIGHRSVGGASVTFHAVPLTPDRVLQTGDGLTHAQLFLNDRRLLICCAPLGRAQDILERCVARVTSTVRYGEPLSEMKNVQATLGRMYAAIEASRATLYRALERMARGEGDPIFDPVVSAAKYFVTEQVRFVLDGAFRVLGGHAYYGDLHFGRYLRDFAGLVAAAGTQDVLEVNLGVAAVTRLRRRTRVTAR
ncbi:acyl-CoA dehydrogenase family protein [Dactylosporangium sp. CA-139066]|uniref:acyl-CoA dehydrogenase family protein n=1 Tax=Dactylosporangium sp. CA-139066 TaxID=3239930 RepID=UPI003D9215B4